MSLGSFRFRLLMQADDDEACRECATDSDFSCSCLVPDALIVKGNLSSSASPFRPLSDHFDSDVRSFSCHSGMNFSLALN